MRPTDCDRERFEEAVCVIVRISGNDRDIDRLHLVLTDLERSILGQLLTGDFQYQILVGHLRDYRRNHWFGWDCIEPFRLLPVGIDDSKVVFDPDKLPLGIRFGD